MKPSHVTCSILLKSIQAGLNTTLINRVFGVVDSVAYEMVAFLMSSAIEAFISINRPDLLLDTSKTQRTRRRIDLQSPPCVRKPRMRLC